MRWRLEVGKARGVEVRGGGRPVRWRLQVGGKTSEVEVAGEGGGGGRIVRWRLEVG